MAFTVTDQRQNVGDTIYYDPGFRQVIETHLPILRRAGGIQVYTVPPEKIYQHEGDFYGLLAEMGISLQFHWIYMRVNGLESAHQFGQQLHDPYKNQFSFQLIIPSVEIIADLKNMYLTTQG